MDSKKIISGVKWAGIQFAFDTIFRFAIRLILAKLLLPEDFGLVAMCTIFISIAEAVSELGMGAALIQRKSSEEAEAMYSTAFWSGLVWGVIIYLLVCFVVGPFAAYFYDENMLLKLVPVLSLGVLLKPLVLIHVVKLTRALQFKKMAKIYNLSALLAGILGISAAYMGFGVWSLAVHQVLSVAITIPLLYRSTTWSPKGQWSRNQFKSVFGFGAYSTGTNVFSRLTYNIDNLMIGKMLGAGLLGSYTLSFSLTEYLRQVISNVLNRVMYPVFSQSQDDKEKLRNYFLKIIGINAIIIYPLMAYLIVFAETIIVDFFGERWAEAVLPLRILAVAMMVHLLVNSFTSLIRGLGKPELEMKIIISLTIFILLPALYIGITYYGLVGASLAILANKIVLVLVGLITLRMQVGLSPYRVISAIKSAIFSVVLAMAPLAALIYFMHFDNIFILTPLYIALYLAVIYWLEKQLILMLLKNLR